MNQLRQADNVDIYYRRSKDVVESKLDDSTCLFHLQSCEYFSLNETGSAIWACLDKPVEIHSIVEQLHPFYNVDKNQLYRDLDAWLKDAAHHGLIDVVH
jgi:hypothetical protein